MTVEKVNRTRNSVSVRKANSTSTQACPAIVGHRRQEVPRQKAITNVTLGDEAGERVATERLSLFFASIAPSLFHWARDDILRAEIQQSAMAADCTSVYTKPLSSAITVGEGPRYACDESPGRH